MKSQVQIEFSKDWKELIKGELKAGSSFDIIYDSERLPKIRDTYNLMPAWGIFAYVKFNSDTDNYFLEKELEKTNKLNKMTQIFDIPQQAEEMTIWFKNIGRSERIAYDSDYGKNFIFRFPEKDILNVNPKLTRLWESSESSFTVYIDTHAKVDYINIRAKIEKDNEIEDLHINCAHEDIKRDSKGFYLYSTVPYGAKISFYIIYWVDGRKYIANNNGEMYKV